MFKIDKKSFPLFFLGLNRLKENKNLSSNDANEIMFKSLAFTEKPIQTFFSMNTMADEKKANHEKNEIQKNLNVSNAALSSVLEGVKEIHEHANLSHVQVKNIKSLPVKVLIGRTVGKTLEDLEIELTPEQSRKIQNAGGLNNMNLDQIMDTFRTAPIRRNPIDLFN